MSRCDRQRAGGFVREFLRHPFDRFRFAQHFAGEIQNHLACRCDVRQVLTAARKNFHAQLVFQQANLLADTRLRCEETLCSRGHIEIVMRDLPDVPKLL